MQESADVSSQKLRANSNSPPGAVIDFAHPYSRGYILIIVSAILIPIVTLFVILRTYAKAFINVGGLGKEDCKEQPFSDILVPVLCW